MTDVLIALIQLMLILILFRIAVTILPGWLLAIVFFIVVLSSGVLDPYLVQQAIGASSELLATVVPFIVVAIGLWMATAGLGRRKG